MTNDDYKEVDIFTSSPEIAEYLAGVLNQRYDCTDEEIGSGEIACDYYFTRLNRDSLRVMMHNDLAFQRYLSMCAIRGRTPNPMDEKDGYHIWPVVDEGDIRRHKRTLLEVL